MAHKAAPAFQPLTGIYEPSAIQQLPDGRFLVVEDEKRHPFSVFTIGAGGTIVTTALSPSWLQGFSDFWKLDDLEGLALSRAGFLYAITSHSRDDEGNEKKSRERLVRFRVEGDQVAQPKVVDGLKRAMTAQHPDLALAATIRDVKADGGLNIEALAITPDQGQLLIGFRGPLRDGRALIARIENPFGIFEADEAPRLSAALDELALGGHGIRGLSYIPALGAYLVVSGPVSREGPFALWCWAGQPGAAARRVTVEGLGDLERAEGVSPALIDGVQRVVIVSDDGERKSGRCANYLLLDLEQLQIAS